MTDQSSAEAHSRVKTLFTYLQELHRVRTPPVANLAEYKWNLPLQNLPEGPTIELGARLGNTFEGAGSYLLRVGRPEEVPCPEPTKVLSQKLARGWDEPHRVARLKRTQGEPHSPALRRSFSTWNEKREDWKKKQAPAALFSQLFEIWTNFERESEKYQLYIGDGILSASHTDGPVYHPLLLQRVELHFDAKIPAFTITVSPGAPEIYAPLLRHMMVDGKALHQIQSVFAENPCDPLGEKETDQFLKELVHTFWPDGFYGVEPQGPTPPAKASVFRKAGFFIGHRTQDYADAIQRFLDSSEFSTRPSEALLRVIGIDTTANEEERTPVDPLLTHPANPEQIRAIQRLQDTGAVLVQGPPGTGKSHTIANLIGHLLAEQKTILITSHTSKALRVVREKVAAPLRSLCVSVLESDDDSTQQLEESITGILNYLSSTSEKEIGLEVEALREEREQLVADQKALSTELLELVAIEFSQLHFGDQTLSPGQLAISLGESEEQHGWIPGKIDIEKPLSLTPDEISELYELSYQVAQTDGVEEADKLPNLDQLPTPDEFEAHLEEARKQNRLSTVSHDDLWVHVEQTRARLLELAEFAKAAEKGLIGTEGWVLECISVGMKGKEATESWRTLSKIIREAAKRIPPRKDLVLKHGPEVQLDWPLKDQLTVCREIVAHLTAGKKLGGIKQALKRDWKTFTQACKTDSGPPESVEQFQAILDHLEITNMRHALALRWDRQMVPLGVPSARELPSPIEETTLPYAERMRTAINWAEDYLHPCEAAFSKAGLDWAQLTARVELPDHKHGNLLRLRKMLSVHLPRVIEAREAFVEQNALFEVRAEWLGYLDQGIDQEQPFSSDLSTYLREGNTGEYRRVFDEASALTKKIPALARRNELLARLSRVAPTWSDAILKNTPPHDSGALPGAGEIEKAWEYRSKKQQLEKITSVDIDDVQTRLNQTTSSLHRVTARYVEKLAWGAQIGRVGLEEQQALAGWLALHKKIGKGSGKNAARLREEAKKTLVKCRAAVPVWIMPLSRVVENFDIGSTKFDVVILDEASQCDILGLVCFAVADQVAVVGDHEQVSPYAVGHKVEKIQGLIDELLQTIPNKQLYDGKTSVYDLARQSFGGTVRLLEHFRCVPEIIQFSNQLCYGGEIRPLREASSAAVRPGVVNRPIADGYKDGKTNEQEAREITALIAALIEQPEYKGCTIGVISMVGTEQSLRIDSLLRRRLSVAEYKRRRILCGNASQFQGDERDIIFLSMVDTPSIDGRRLAIKQRDDVKKQFNVAASRARDQMWVVHGLDPEKDLKAGDLRLKLLNYAQKPDVLAQTKSDQEPTSFELDVAKCLREKGFQIVVHGAVGNYQIDLVASGQSGARVGVLCDGGRDQSAEELEERIGRQMTLERLGWSFVRVSASGFYAARQDTVAKIVERMESFGVTPGVGREPDQEEESELISRVIKRAQAIRNRSQSLEYVPMPDFSTPPEDSQDSQDLERLQTQEDLPQEDSVPNEEEE